MSCDPKEPLPLSELLRSEFWRDRFYQPVDFEWQPTLFQPVGGMDEIVWGLMRRIGHLAEFQSVIEDIRVHDSGVRVTYHDHLTGDRITKNADYCISNIPLPFLNSKTGNVKSNFEGDFRTAIDRGRFQTAAKVAWQANSRFWENDRNQIYGGISWINDLITQIWYPSNDYFTKNGTLTGAYIYDTQAEEFGGWSLEKRLDEARKGAARLHPEF